MTNSTLIRPFPQEIRHLITRAFASESPVPRRMQAQSGAIRNQLRSLSSEPGMIVCPDLGMRVADAGAAAPYEYWLSALPERVLIIGPLFSIIEADFDEDRFRVHEEAIMSAYFSLGAQPLPADLLRLLSRTPAAGRSGVGEHLLRFLERGTHALARADCIDEVLDARTTYRVEALRRGSTGRWPEDAVPVAELMIDVLASLHALRIDVEHAMTVRANYGGSIARALYAADEEQSLSWGAYLPRMIREPTDLPIDDSEREALTIYQRSRERLDPGLLSTPDTTGPLTDIVTPALVRTARQPIPERRPHLDPPEDPRTTYRDLVRGLEDRIISRPTLCRRLALTGLAFLLGQERIRLLLLGPTGSGKTPAAKALADVLERPYTRVDASQITGFGWRGLEVNSLLDDLARKDGGDLRGKILLLDEIDKLAVPPDVDGVSRESKRNAMAAVLGVLDGYPITSEDSGRQLDTSDLMVVGTGSFWGRFTDGKVTTADLTEAGWTEEMSARWGSRLVLNPLTRVEAIHLLSDGERAVERYLAPLISALDIDVTVAPATLAYVAELWTATRADYRSMAGLIIEAAQRRIGHALETGSETSIVITPDDIAYPLARSAER